MSWFLLTAAGVFEVVWAFAMKTSDGFTRPVPVPVLITIAGMALSVGFLALAMRSLPLGTAYAVWTGIGAVGAFVAGAAFLGEPVTPMRTAAALMIVAGIVLMKAAS